MANKIKGLTIEIGGETTGLTKALTGVNKQSKDLQAELRNVDKLLKLDPKNTELITQKQKLLAESVSNTKNKLDTLKEAEKQAQAQFQQGKIGEDQYRAIQREVIATTEELKKLEKQSKEFGGNLTQNLKNAGQAMQDFGGKVTSAGQSLTTKVTLPLAAAGGVAFKFAADLQDAMGASDQIFKNSAGEIKAWADGLESHYGIAESEALTYANTMGAMLQNIGGLSEEEAAKQSQILIELAGDMTAMFGGTTESAVQALTGALKGNNSMLDNYGMGVNEATIKTKALEMGLIEEGDQLDLAGKQAATLALIMEQTADAQGQAAREAEGASGSMRSLTTELKNIAGELGEILLPIITPFIQKIGEITGKFKELSPETQEIIVKVGLLVAAIGPLLLIIGKTITIVGTITAALPVLGTAFTALTGPIGIAIAAVAAIIAIGVLLYKNWDTVKAKAGELKDAVVQKFNDIKTGIAEKIDGAKESVRLAIEKIKGFFNFTWKLPELKMPHFSIKGKFSLDPPQIPKIGVDWYDKGGIFNSPTIIGIGEKRPEFVGALDDLRKIVREESNNIGGSINNNFNIASLVVREEADIKRISRELYNLQQSKLRAKGER